MRRLSLLAVVLMASTSLASAQTDPVVARVANEDIRASELTDAAQNLPEELRGMPAPVLFPMLIDQLIDRRIIVLAARKAGLDRDPAVQKQISRATDSALQNALLSRDIGPGLTDDAVKARYDRDFAGKPGEEEIRARHILVPDEAQAKAITAQLAGGGDFAELARTNSKDPGATNGGDLGFFKKTDMLPEFSDAAFALKPGEVTAAPVQTRFGWHIIKLEERRAAPPPALEQVRDEIRQIMIQEGVSRVLAAARVGIAVEKFKPDGSPLDPVTAPIAAPGSSPPLATTPMTPAATPLTSPTATPDNPVAAPLPTIQTPSTPAATPMTPPGAVAVSPTAAPGPTSAPTAAPTPAPPPAPAQAPAPAKPAAPARPAR